MDERTRKLTTRYARLSVGVGLLFTPLPMLDEVVVVPLHYALCRKLAKERGVRPKDLPWKQLRRIIWWGAGARTALAASLSPIPIAGTVANVVTAYALTEFLSTYLDEALSHPERPAREITRADLVNLFERSRERVMGMVR
jgi:hypothetical protein